MGYGQIERALKINRSNVQDSIKELQRKFSVRVFRESTVGSATVYEVYCCDDILAKRDAAGFRWAFRYGGRRADLIKEPSDPTSTPSDLTPIGARPPGPRQTASPPVGIKPTAPIGLAPIQLANKQSVLEVSSSSEALVADEQTTTLTRLLRVDISSAKRIWRHCASAMPDITPEEIEGQFTPKLRALFQAKMKSPIGFMVTDMDTWFNPDPIRQGREAKAAEKAENDAYWREVLADPDATEEMKALAKGKLSES
jgi:hypothetical protein